MKKTTCALLLLGLLASPPLWAEEGPETPPVLIPTEASLTIVPTPDDKTLHPGDSEVYEFDGITTTAVGSPSIVDIVPISGRRLLVNAKGIGQTTLFVYDKRGKHILRFAVLPLTSDLGPIAAQVQAEIGLPGVTVHAIKDTLFLEGTVPSVIALQRASAIAGVYAPKLRNLIAVAPIKEDVPEVTLAQTYAALLTANLKETGIRVQIVGDKTIALIGEYALARSAPDEEPASSKTRARPARSTKKGVGKSDTADEAPETDTALAGEDRAKSRTATAHDPLDRLLQSLPSELKVIDLINIGRRPTRQILVHAKIIDIDRSASKSLGIDWGTLNAGTSRSGPSYSFQSQPILFGQTYRAFDGPGSLFGGGKLNRILPLAVQLNLLISENKAKVLSEPSLMVLDGSEGSILVGGEIPIPVAQGSSGTNGASASVTIEYKPYGVRLLLQADIVGDNAVQMTVTPEVSDLNYGAALQISGFLVPALTVRRATSTLQMADGETLVIGGLYSNTMSRQVDRVPVLSQIPILGELFKSTTTRKEENELLILIQPEIVTPSTPGAHPPPPGSLENPSIVRPGVGKADFDKDFPSLQRGGADREKPGPPVNLPPLPKIEGTK